MKTKYILDLYYIQECGDFVEFAENCVMHRICDAPADIITEEKTKNQIGGGRKPHRKGVSYLHWHKNFEIVRTKNKPCRFKVKDEYINAAPGDIVAIDEYVIHQFLIDEDDNDLLVIQFSLDLFMDAHVPLKPLKKHITNQEIESIPGLEEKISALTDIFESEMPVRVGEDNPFLRSIAMSLYYLLMRHFSDESYNKNKFEEREEFYKIIEYINEHFCEEINASVIADKMFMSRAKVTKLFHKYSGAGVKEYITINRIKKANLLMLQGYDITKAAYESGFQSVRTFNEVYKKQMGITPSEYKQRKEAL